MTDTLDELDEIRERHEAFEGLHAWSDNEARRAHTDRATLLRLLDAARRSPLKSPAPFSKEPDMPVNTNDLRDMASEFRETTLTRPIPAKSVPGVKDTPLRKSSGCPSSRAL